MFITCLFYPCISPPSHIYNFHSNILFVFPRKHSFFVFPPKHSFLFSRVYMSSQNSMPLAHPTLARSQGYYDPHRSAFRDPLPMLQDGVLLNKDNVKFLTLTPQPQWGATKYVPRSPSTRPPSCHLIFVCGT